MSTENEKQERRARRMAAARGYYVRKSRKQFSSDNFGELRLIDADTNGVVMGERFDASPDDIISFLTE
jgi:hypothetical protein